MSKYVDEIIKDIRDNPNSWKRLDTGNCYDGIQKGNIKLTQYGNTRLLSIINVEIDNVRQRKTYLDSWRLESAVTWWYKNIGLNHLITP